jgi:hypothetical protein
MRCSGAHGTPLGSKLEMKFGGLFAFFGVNSQSYYHQKFQRGTDSGYYQAAQMVSPKTCVCYLRGLDFLLRREIAV